MNKKEQLLSRIEHQTNTKLIDDSKKRNWIHAEINDPNVLYFLNKNGIRHEKHIKNYYFIKV